jgi:hypothetical protein
LAITLIGLPFARAHLKLAGIALWPIGKIGVFQSGHPRDRDRTAISAPNGGAGVSEGAKLSFVSRLWRHRRVLSRACIARSEMRVTNGVVGSAVAAVRAILMKYPPIPRLTE